MRVSYRLKGLYMSQNGTHHISFSTICQLAPRLPFLHNTFMFAFRHPLRFIPLLTLGLLCSLPAFGLFHQPLLLFAPPKRMTQVDAKSDDQQHDTQAWYTSMPRAPRIYSRSAGSPFLPFMDGQKTEQQQASPFEANSESNDPFEMNPALSEGIRFDD